MLKVELGGFKVALAVFFGNVLSVCLFVDNEVDSVLRFKFVKLIYRLFKWQPLETAMKINGDGFDVSDESSRLFRTFKVRHKCITAKYLGRDVNLQKSVC